MIRFFQSTLILPAITMAWMSAAQSRVFSQDSEANAPVASQVLVVAPAVPLASPEVGDGIGDLIEKAKIPQAVNGSFQLPPLLAPSTAQNLAELRQVPKDFRNERKVPSIQLPESGKDRDEHWEWTTVKWKAPNTFSNPRYFEDRMLERHGHQSSERLQPLLSGARFFATIPMIPYLMAVSEPQEKEYTLGYYRTGSDVPSLRQRPPYERRGVLSEAAVVTGLFLLVP